MNLQDFSDQQKQALLDLAALAMYADGHLSSAEDERVLRLLLAMGFQTEEDRRRQYDDSITRVSRHSVNASSANAYAETMAKAFTTSEQRRVVADTLQDLVRSDEDISAKENSFLTLVSQALRT